VVRDVQSLALRALAGRLVSESDDYSSIVYVYDTAGNLLSTTTASLDMPTVVLTNEYDGGLSQFSSDENGTVPLARRTRLSAAIDGVADFVNEYRYDDLNRITAFGQYDVNCLPSTSGRGAGGEGVLLEGEAFNAVAEKFVDLSY